jgi:hypothetical protein
MHKVPVLFRESHSLSDVARVDGDGRGMSCGVTVPSIERGYES